MKARRAYNAAFKRRAVRLAEQVGAADAARRLRVPEAAIYRWRRRNGTANVLPTKPGGGSPKPKALKPVTFKCPHCGGPVVLP